MKRHTITVIALTLVTILILGCSVSRGPSARVTPAATKTLRPVFTSTFTPAPTQAPTDTAVPTSTPSPTDTAIPPTDAPPATDTAPAPPTEAPATDTPLPPSDTPQPAAPSDTPRPQPTNTPAPPTNTPSPQVDFVIEEITPFVDGSIQESGFHNIYFTVVDAQGQPLDNIILEDTNSQPPIQLVTGQKGPGKAEFTMVYADYNFKVAADTGGRTYTSEITHRLSMIPGHYHWPDMIAAGICSNEAECRALGSVHFSYNITFQRAW